MWQQSLQAPPLLYCLPPGGSGGPDRTLGPLEPPGAGMPDSAAAKGDRSQQVWNSAPGSIAGDTQRERGPKTRSGGHDAPWMTSYGSDLLDPQAAQSRLAEAAPNLDAEEAAPHCFAAAATARKRRWEILLGNERLLWALATLFCLLLSVASLPQIKPRGQSEVLHVVVPFASVLPFLPLEQQQKKPSETHLNTHHLPSCCSFRSSGCLLCCFSRLRHANQQQRHLYHKRSGSCPAAADAAAAGVKRRSSELLLLLLLLP